MGGVQRATKFARYLPEFGWQPHVVTVKDIHYYAKDESLLAEVDELNIYRAGSLDPARLAKFMIGLKSQRPKIQPVQTTPVTNPSVGRMAGWLRRVFYPDAKLLWLPFASRIIKQLQRQVKFHAVFSTSPPVSAHLLAAKTNLPWIADFRDYWSIGDGIYAPTAWHRRRYREIIELICRRANKIITISAPIADAIRTVAGERYRDKILVVPNGFDPNDFRAILPQVNDRFALVYAGNLNPQRSPARLFGVLEEILFEQPELQEKFWVIFLGKHFELDLKPLSPLLQTHVKFVDYLPHDESVAIIKGANALLLLLASNSAAGVVTGKVFEYLGSGKPILALIPPHVSAYELLVKMPNCILTDPDDSLKIKKAVLTLLKKYLEQPVVQLDYNHLPDYLVPYTRQEQTRQLASLLNDACSA